MALVGEALAKYNAQFQRSSASPGGEAPAAPKVVLDGGAVLEKYLAGQAASAMSGAEFYAVVGHIKRQHGSKGEVLEQELMKITRQADKKFRLVEWCTQTLGASVPAAAPKSAAKAAALLSPPLANVENLPPAGTPSRPSAYSKADMGISRLDLSGAMAGERDVGQETARVRPATARPQLGGDAMAGLLGATTPRAAPPLTARPATAADAAPAAVDMSACLSQFAAGRDHLKMSGSEYYNLLAWLKAHGHGEIEDVLLKVRTLGDKKYHLAKYIRDKCSSLVQPTAPPVMQSAPVAEAAAPPPVQMGDAQVLQLAAAPAAPAPPAVAALQQSANIQSSAIMNAVAAIQQAAPVAGGSNAAVLEGVRQLEGTLGRLEESLNFAVECMQSDLGNAKAQLQALKMQVGI